MLPTRLATAFATLACSVLLGSVGAARAALLTVSWEDVDDSGPIASSANLRTVTLTLDNVTGDYTFEMTAAPFKPFQGVVRVNLNTYNVDAGMRLFDNGNDILVVPASETLQLSDNTNDLGIRSWRAGDRVVHCSHCGHGLPVPFVFTTSVANDILVSDPLFSIIEAVPEPAIALQLGLGLLGIALLRSGSG